jgi:hypothetical protein
VSPSVVVGDTLRDTLGVIQPLHATAYNINDDTLATYPIRYRALDPGITVDSLTGIVVGDSLVGHSIRIVADAGGLQTQALTLVVIPVPDTVVTVTEDARDSLLYSLFDSTKNVSAPLTLQVLHHSATTLDPVPSYIVSFAIQSPTDTLLAQLVGDNGQTSFVDTTDANGQAGRRIRIRPAALSSTTDSVVVLGTVKYRGVPIVGSPIRFVLQVKPEP